MPKWDGLRVAGEPTFHGSLGRKAGKVAIVSKTISKILAVFAVVIGAI